MTGKSKCRILKDIRRQIARDNDIEFVTSECRYQGECSGTCPKCEAELRYLEDELAKRQKAGKAVAVAGIAAAFMISTAGCLPVTTRGAPMPDDSTSYIQDVVRGLIVPPDTTEIQGGIIEPTLQGDVPWTEPTEGVLMGDLVPPEE